MRLPLIVAAVVAFSISALSMDPGHDQSGSSNGDDLRPMPAMTLQDLDGKAVSTDQFKDSVVLFDFWATWCRPCIAEIPVLNRLQEKYKNQGLKVIGVTLASGEAGEVKPFVNRLKMEYSVVMGNDDQAYTLNILGFPTTYLVTRDWKVYQKYIGAGPLKEQQMESDIKRLIGGKAGQ